MKTLIDWAAVPHFGERLEMARVLRPSAYAVLTDERGRVAIVFTSQGVFLPGGGIEADETPEQAVERETKEECGLVVRLRPWPGTASQAVELVYSKSEGIYFEKRCTFLRGTAVPLTSRPTESGHVLRWVTPVSARLLLTPGSHRNALEQIQPA